MNQVKNFLKEYLRKGEAPSVQYVIFDKENILHEFKDGFADVDKKIKVAGDMTYQAYSVTKTFTALAILQLAEQGKLDIDDLIGKFMPEAPYASLVSIRQLLAHTAGVPNPIS